MKKQPLTEFQIETQDIIDRLMAMSKERDGMFIIAGDVKTDTLFAVFNNMLIPAEIKSPTGEKMDLIRKILEYNDDEHAVNSLLHFIDGALYAFHKKFKKKSLIKRVLKK